MSRLQACSWPRAQTLVMCVPVLYVIFVEDLHLVRWEQESEHDQHGESVLTPGAVAELAHA